MGSSSLETPPTKGYYPIAFAPYQFRENGTDMYSGQQAILRLVRARGGSVGRLDLIKLLFLTREDLDDKARGTFYGFVPYKYGPYSFAANRDLTKLAERGYLRFPDERTVTLTEMGVAEDRREIKNATLAQSLTLTERRARGLGTHELLDQVYREHPWFTLNTVRSCWSPPQRPVAEPAVYTVGYEGRQVDSFLNLLLRAGIKALVDVRKTPLSRRYGFHRSTLSSLCSHVGVEYTHLPEFGIPSELRRGLDCDDAYDRLFATYRHEVLPELQAELDSLASRMAETPTALMCAEKDPRHCHRTHLAAAVSGLCGLPVHDITGGTQWHSRERKS